MTDLCLSRLMLDPRSRQVQRESTDVYQMHRTIMKAFEKNRQESGVLYRLENQKRNNQLTLLVQSTAEPDWSSLDGRSYLQAVDPFSGLPNPAVKRINMQFQKGQVLNFRLRANPSIKKKREGRHSNRVPLVREEKQETWLKRKGQQHGFSPVRFWISGQGNRLGWKKNGQKRKKLTIYDVQFDGVLAVVDPQTFADSLILGIGPAKAFGCGLLSLAPA